MAAPGPPPICRPTGPTPPAASRFQPLTAPVGAAAGEYLAQKDQTRAVKVGVSTWIGIMVGLIAKVVLAFIMVGIFLAALLI